MPGESGHVSQGLDHKDLVRCVENFGPYPKSSQMPFKGLKRVTEHLMCFCVVFGFVFIKDKVQRMEFSETGRDMEE